MSSCCRIAFEMDMDVFISISSCAPKISAQGTSRDRCSKATVHWICAHARPGLLPIGRGSLASVPLEILHFALVLLGRRARLERSEIAALAGVRIGLARIEPVLASFEFADHRSLLCSRRNAR